MFMKGSTRVASSSGRRERRRPPAPPPGSSRAGDGRLPQLATVILAVACLVVVTLVPVPTGDLFMALAGGRDALAGRLGQPDDWSFLTAGRVWVNQNWGAGVVFYLTHQLAGEGGLVALKAVLTLGVLAAMAALGRSAGASWPAALLAATVGLWVGRRFPELRPNLFTMVFAPLVVLLLRGSAARPWRLAAAVGVVAVWANTHGGFMLGLLLLGLWTVARCLSAIRHGGLKASVGGAGPAAAACLAGVLLAGLATPFGWTNLTFALRLTEPGWRRVVEWAPLRLVPHEVFGSPWEFLAVAVVALAATVARQLHSFRSPQGRCEAIEATTWFDLGAALLVTAMAVSAWRFVGVAVVILAPLAAPVLERLLQPDRRPARAMTAVVALAFLAAPFTARVLRHYRIDHPRFAGGGMFYRLLELDTFPTGAAEFLRANCVHARAFNDWRWEGYLRWVAPQVRLFTGGRAQQIYDWTTVARGQALPGNPTPAAELAALGVDLVIVPMHLAYDGMVQRLALRKGSHWLIVYYDGRDVVLVDSHASSQRSLVELARSGEARYPSAAVAETSRALLLACPASGATGPEQYEALARASLRMPTIAAYWAMAELARWGEIDTSILVGFLEREQARLSVLDHRQGGGVELLKAKWALAWQLSDRYAAVGHREEAARQAGSAALLRAELKALLHW